jgi:hypothetical protein
MAKGLPYFKFTPTEWLTGDICFESFEVQGLFINICALYWQRDGKLSIDDIEKRYKKPTALVSLIDRFITVTDGVISIAFLDEQFIERKHISVVNSDNGSKGGRPKTKGKKPTAKRIQSEDKANESQQEEEGEEEINKNKKFTPPLLSEVTAYFIENGYTEQSAVKAFHYYDTAAWKDSKGNKVKNWKQKMQGVWFKEENKLQKPKTSMPVPL